MSLIKKNKKIYLYIYAFYYLLWVCGFARIIFVDAYMYKLWLDFKKVFDDYIISC